MFNFLAASLERKLNAFNWTQAPVDKSAAGRPCPVENRQAVGYRPSRFKAFAAAWALARLAP